MEDIIEEYCNKSIHNKKNCTLEYETMIMTQGVTAEAVLVPLTFAIIFVFGLVGNILLICSYVKFKTLNAPHNIFVINVAVGDLIMLVVSLPFNSTWYTISYWPYGEAVCKMSSCVETLATSVTIATITVLSVERFLIITGNRSGNKKLFAVMVVIIIWTLSFYLSLPDLLSATTVIEEHSGHFWEYCYSFSPSWGPVYPKVNTIMRFLLLFVIPICIISPLYLAIAYNIYFKPVTSKYPSMKTPLRCDPGSKTVSKLEGKSSQDKRKRLAFSVLGLVWAFVVCWLPRHIYLLWFHFDPNGFDHFWHIFKIIGFCLMFSNCAVNPVVFYILDKKFRQYIQLTVCCKTTVRESHSVITPEGQTIGMTDFAQGTTRAEDV